jgi:flagellar hook-basal body complex protein FliE
VAGTTPGGELGGTWDSPTVDATHSGSTHSAATDTHIADGTDAHDASAISFSPVGTIAATDVQAAIAEVASEASSVGDLDDLTDVTITAPEANQQLQYIGGVWVNNHRRWEPVTTNPGAGPEIVFDGDEIVMTWADYS